MNEFRFRIDAFTPDSMPMARLAQYMTQVAALLGHEPSVHFVRLEPGSVGLVHRVDHDARPKVDDRLEALRRGEGPPDAVRAHRRLDEMLAEDDAVGALEGAPGEVLMEFGGRSRPKPAEFGSFSQPGTVDGVALKVGGPSDLVPVHLQEKGQTTAIHHCLASRQVARAIATHLFEAPLRVHGTGRWRRTASGTWTLTRFVISDFEVLDDTPLDQVVAHLRNVPGDGWHSMDNPLEVLRDLRGNADDLH